MRMRERVAWVAWVAVRVALGVLLNVAVSRVRDRWR
jgi:hypothetical protein